MPQSPGDAAEAEQQEQDDTGDGADDDSGDGAAAQRVAGGGDGGRARAGGRLRGARERARGRGLGRGRPARGPVWSRELSGDIDAGGHDFGPRTEAWIGQTLAFVGAILPVCAADEATGYLAGPRRRNTGATIASHASSSRGNVPGADCAGEGQCLGPRCRIIPLSEKMSQTGACWGAGRRVAGLVGGAAQLVLGTAVLGTFLRLQVAEAIVSERVARVGNSSGEGGEKKGEKRRRGRRQSHFVAPPCKSS